MMKINKKITIILLVSALILLKVFTYLFLGHSKQLWVPIPTVNPNIVSIRNNEITNGQVTQVKSKSIIVSGVVNSSDNNNKPKTIEFIITSETILKKTLTTLPDALTIANPNSPAYSPKIEQMKGATSDLKVGTILTLIQSKDNLSVVSKTTATEIDYIITQVSKSK